MKQTPLTSLPAKREEDTRQGEFTRENQAHIKRK